jgi:hypothetical protein
MPVKLTDNRKINFRPDSTEVQKEKYKVGEIC